MRRDDAFNLCKVESLYEENLDIALPREPHPWLVHQSFGRNAFSYKICFHHIDSAAYKARHILTDGYSLPIYA